MRMGKLFSAYLKNKELRMTPAELERLIAYFFPLLDLQDNLFCCALTGIPFNFLYRFTGRRLLEPAAVTPIPIAQQRATTRSVSSDDRRFAISS